MLLLPVVTTLLLTLLHAAAAHAERWTAPLPGAAVVREFDFDARVPFARGRHRGVLLGAAPGATVRAPCSGRVTFAGRHPRLGPGLTIRCRGLAATAFGLERPLVRRGTALVAGTPVGLLGGRGRLHLGARLAHERWGYRDPLTLLGGGPGGPAPLAPPPGRARRVVRRTPPSRPPDAASRAPRAAPLAAWAGLAAAGVGAGAGVTLRRRGLRARRRPAARRAGSGQRTH